MALIERGQGVPEAIAQARLVRYQERQRVISLETNQALVGQRHHVLVEGPSRHDNGVICGRTSTFKMINFPGHVDQVGPKWKWWRRAPLRTPCAASSPDGRDCGIGHSVPLAIR